MKIFITATLLLTTIVLKAQKEHNPILMLELMGNAKHVSINYDSRFGKKNNGLGYQAGIGGTINYYYNTPTINTPLGLNYTLGSHKHKALIGVVAIPEYFPKTNLNKKLFFRSNINAGYRYESNKGIVLNAIWTPQVYSDDNLKKLRNKNKALWFGLGVGIKI